MKLLGYNAALAVVWAALQGTIDLLNLFVGFAIGYVVLWLCRPLLDRSGYFWKLPLVASFLVYFARELVVSSARVAWDVVTPRDRRRPAVVAVPLDLESDTAITLLANIVTLTPGTLSLDISPDRRTLYVHGMFVDDPAAFRREIKDGFERRIRELLR
ncbi:MAG: Na+/H+ antiporter subunit E [Candidatus Krumholzibacteriia bacterium]